MSEIHNLDEVQEYFEFIVGGHTYRFRFFNTEETEEMQKFVNDDQKTKEFLFKFITKKDETSPDFSEVSKKMTVPQWIKFRKMLEVEFKG